MSESFFPFYCTTLQAINGGDQNIKTEVCFQLKWNRKPWKSRELVHFASGSFWGSFSPQNRCVCSSLYSVSGKQREEWMLLFQVLLTGNIPATAPRSSRAWWWVWGILEILMHWTISSTLNFSLSRISAGKKYSLINTLMVSHVGRNKQHTQALFSVCKPYLMHLQKMIRKANLYTLTEESLSPQWNSADWRKKTSWSLF